jgi:hypothetical protein
MPISISSPDYLSLDTTNALHMYCHRCLLTTCYIYCHEEFSRIKANRPINILNIRHTTIDKQQTKYSFTWNQFCPNYLHRTYERYAYKKLQLDHWEKIDDRLEWIFSLLIHHWDNRARIFIFKYIHHVNKNKQKTRKQKIKTKTKHDK